jgi:putative DNA primase/helicase
MRDVTAIAAALGGRRDGKKGWWKMRCPAHADHNPSLSMCEHNGAVKCHSGCTKQEILAALDALGFVDDGSGTSIDYEAIRQSEEERIACAQFMWEHEALPEAGAVAYYLARRGITLAVPAVMRRWSMNGFIACVQQLDGTITGVFYKIPVGNRKGITHGVLRGGAVQLTPVGDSGELGLAEGVETALSATQLFGIPCWATLGAERLHQIELPSSVRRLHLFVDNDDAGRKAVTSAVAHYCDSLGLHVREWWPPEQYKDWNDVVKEKQTTC